MLNSIQHTGKFEVRADNWWYSYKAENNW